MSIISFSWTTAPLVAGAKTVTRREWKDEYAAQFRTGQRLAAYDRSPRFGGQAVAVIELTEAPYRESSADAPQSDYAAEGLAWLEERGRLLGGLGSGRHAPHARAFWRLWHAFPRDLWVVRFTVVPGSLTPLGEELLGQIMRADERRRALQGLPPASLPASIGGRR